MEDSKKQPPGCKPSTRCCHQDPSKGRNLIVCIDGTANQFGEMNTNVIELYNLILKATEDNQRTFYNSGIGTYARPHWRSWKYRKQVIFHKIDLTIAWDFEKHVQSAYRWLSDNYEDGDCIFIFGFSRGAFQARVLSAMIDRVGLIHRGNESQIPFAYELYADSDSDLARTAPVGSTGKKPPEPAASPEQPKAKSLLSRLKDGFWSLLGFSNREQAPSSDGSQDLPSSHGDQEPLLNHETDAQDGDAASESVSMAERFKRAFSREGVVVHFVGAWDTVSAIGIARGMKVLPGTTDGMTHVCYFRHALALDECRVKFLPEFVWGGSALPDPEAVDYDIDAYTKSWGERPHTLEVWFPGTHSDIGGGNAKNAGMDRSRPPLRWMALEAAAAGLKLRPFGHELPLDKQIEFKESLTGFWWLLECLPLQRLTFNGPKELTRMPHLASGRQVQQGQRIHSSLVLAKVNTPYIPKASPPTGKLSFWDDLRKDGILNSNNLLEIDIYDYPTAQTLLRMFLQDRDDQVLECVKRIATDKSGAQALYDEVTEIIKRWERRRIPPTIDVKYRLLRDAIEILRQSTIPQLAPLPRIRHSLNDLRTSNIPDYKKMAIDFLSQLTDRSVKGHIDWASAISSGEVAQALYKELLVTLTSWTDLQLSIEDKFRFSDQAVDFFRRQSTHLQLTPLLQIRHLLDDLRTSDRDDYKKVANTFMSQLTDRSSSLELKGHIDWVSESSVAHAEGSVGQVLYDELVITITSWTVLEPKTSIEDQSRLLNQAVDYLQDQSTHLQLIPLLQIRHSLDELRTSNREDYRKAANDFLSQLADRSSSLELKGHIDWVSPKADEKDVPQALYDELVVTVTSWIELQPTPTIEDKYLLLNQALDFLQPRSTHLQLVPLPRIRHLLVDLRTSDRDDYKQVANDFLSQLTDRRASFELKGHTDLVWCVAFSPDSKRIFSGGNNGDPMIRIWDAYTGAQLGVLAGHTHSVSSIAFFPDHKRIVSSSVDCTIRIWDVETREQAGEPLRGHSSNVRSVVISPDGKRIVSGSYDKTIRIWDAETGTQVGEPLQGHTDYVESVAISPDGRRIVSSGNDNTIRIWDAETGEQVGEPLVGHTDGVRSVAISPDGKRIVSASEDSTIRIWDIETREQVGEPLQGHTGWVYSVAISPDGKLIASGASDKKIRLWDMEGGTQVRKALPGHTESVRSVAFSTDGKSIVSGSRDQTVRVWNVEGILAENENE
ncbi:hypothetical protein MD484_g6797, partial [Candolleomyces efflorescens]